MRVELEDVEEVLEGWTREQLVAHLTQFPAAVLDSSPSERRFVTFLQSAAAAAACRCSTVPELWDVEAREYADARLDALEPAAAPTRGDTAAPEPGVSGRRTIPHRAGETSGLPACVRSGSSTAAEHLAGAAARARAVMALGTRRLTLEADLSKILPWSQRRR